MQKTGKPIRKKVRKKNFKNFVLKKSHSHILRDIRHVHRRQPRHDAEPAGNKRQDNYNRNGMEQQQDTEDDADGAQDAVAGILGGERVVEVDGPDETGPEPEEEYQELDGKDGTVDRVQEDEEAGKDIHAGKQDFQGHVRPVDGKAGQHEYPADKPVGAEEGDEHDGGDGRGYEERKADDDGQDAPQEQEPPGEKP